MKTRNLRLLRNGAALLTALATQVAVAQTQVFTNTRALSPIAAANGTAASDPAPAAFAPVNVLLATGPAVSTNLSLWAAQIAKLAGHGIDQAVLLSFVDAAGTFNLTADQIIALTQAGVPRDVISAMIQHDADIIAGVRPVFASTVPDSVVPPPLVAAKPAFSPTGDVQAEPLTPAESPPFDQFDPGMALFYDDPIDDRYQTPETSPVRKPYPVKLTDPIIVFRGSGRTPNLTIFEGFR